MAKCLVGLKNRLSTQRSGGLSGIGRHNYFTGPSSGVPAPLIFNLPLFPPRIIDVGFFSTEKEPTSMSFPDRERKLNARPQASYMAIVPDPRTLKVKKLGFPLFEAFKELEEALLGAVKRGHRFHGSAFHFRKQETRDDSFQ